MQRVIIKRIRRAGFQVLNDAFTKFEGAGGYTHVVIIGESCIDVHTWPEHGTAHVRIFYCNFTQDNTGKAERLLASFKELFEPSTVKEHAGREYPAVL
jgi:S-adenosylmethionine/arginine decarboxylase-like enzyme